MLRGTCNNDNSSNNNVMPTTHLSTSSGCCWHSRSWVGCATALTALLKMPCDLGGLPLPKSPWKGSCGCRYDTQKPRVWLTRRMVHMILKQNHNPPGMVRLSRSSAGLQVCLGAVQPAQRLHALAGHHSPDRQPTQTGNKQECLTRVCDGLCCMHPSTAVTAASKLFWHFAAMSTSTLLQEWFATEKDQAKEALQLLPPWLTRCRSMAFMLCW